MPQTLPSLLEGTSWGGQHNVVLNDVPYEQHAPYQATPILQVLRFLILLEQHMYHANDSSSFCWHISA